MTEPKIKRKPDEVSSKSRGVGMGFCAVAAAVTLGSALFVRQCVQSEDIQRTPPAQAAAPVQDCPETKAPPARTCPAQRACPATVPAPSKTDDKCEPDKGEADMRSPNYDANNCGRCGDGIAQPHEYPSASVPDPLPPGYVECDVDFHCGNDRLERNAEYGLLEPVLGKDAQGNDVVVGYGVRIIKITETCREGQPAYCAADCPTGGSRIRRPDDGEEPVVAVQPPPSREVPPCPGDVTGSTGGQSVSRRVNSGILGAAGQLRNALGASGQRIDVSTRLLVDAGGRLTLDGASAQCDGADCSGSADVISTARLSISGLTVAAPGEQCRWTIRTRIPAE